MGDELEDRILLLGRAENEQTEHILSHNSKSAKLGSFWVASSPKMPKNEQNIEPQKPFNH